jgi:hypothetical protein
MGNSEGDRTSGQAGRLVSWLAGSLLCVLVFLLVVYVGRYGMYVSPG